MADQMDGEASEASSLYLGKPVAEFVETIPSPQTEWSIAPPPRVLSLVLPRPHRNVCNQSHIGIVARCIRLNDQKTPVLFSDQVVTGDLSRVSPYSHAQPCEADDMLQSAISFPPDT